MQNQKKITKYRYFIVFLCMFTQAVPFGIAQDIQPLFVHPLVNTFHFSLASYTLIFTFGALTSSILSPFIGKALAKFNFKLMYFIGIIISTIALCIFGISSKLPEFYGAGVLCMIGSVFFSSQGIPWIINHWFPTTGRGTALGIAFCGGSLGNIFLQPATQHIFAKYMVGGPKNGTLSSMQPFFIFATALFVIGTLVTLFIRLPNQQEAHLLNTTPTKNKVQAKTQQFTGWGVKEILKMKSFWVFSTGFLIIGLGLASLSEDYAAFLDTKLTFASVGIIGSMYGVGCFLGNVFGGILFDKLGTAKAMTFSGCMYLISLAMMIFISLQPNFAPQNKIAGILYALFCGLAVFTYMSGPAFMTKDLFGIKDQGVMLGLVGLPYAIGFAIEAPLFGILRDLFNFTIAWSTEIIFIVIGFVLLIGSVIHIKKLQQKMIKQA